MSNAADRPAQKPANWKTRLLATRVGGYLVTTLIFLCIKFLYQTTRKRFVGEQVLQKFFSSGQPIIFAAWHNRGLLVLFGYLAWRPEGRELYLSASQSRDGDLAARVFSLLGIRYVRGSSSKRATQSLLDLVKLNRGGNDIGFATDGPHGPLYEVKPGTIAAAKMTGAPILPVTYMAKHKLRLKSWDRLILPLPFTRINYVYGEPIYVDRACDDAGARAHSAGLARELHRIGELAGRFE